MTAREEEEEEFARREKTSLVGFRLLDWVEDAESTPSFLGGSAGFAGVVEFQRTANESDM